MMTRRHAIAATGGLVAAVAGAAAQTVPAARSNGTMEIKRSGSQPSRKGPAEYFTGSVRVDPLFQAGDPARQEALLRRALELVDEDVEPGACALLRERLSQAERRIEILLRDNQGRPVAAAFKEPPPSGAPGSEDENGF